MNFKQGIILFLINLLVLFVLVINILFYSNGLDAGMNEIVKTFLITALVIFGIIYAIMQMYIYPMVVTFDLRISQILKNSLLFAIYKLPQNLFFLALSVIIFGLLVFLGEWMPVLYALLPCIAYSFIMLMQLFYCFEVISSAMIKKEDTVKDQDEHTFKDTL